MQFIVSRLRNCALYPPLRSTWADEVKFDTASNCTNFERERVDEVRRWLDNYYAPGKVWVKEDRGTLSGGPAMSLPLAYRPCSLPSWLAFHAASIAPAVHRKLLDLVEKSKA